MTELQCHIWSALTWEQGAKGLVVKIITVNILLLQLSKNVDIVCSLWFFVQ